MGSSETSKRCLCEINSRRTRQLRWLNFSLESIWRLEVENCYCASLDQRTIDLDHGWSHLSFGSKKWSRGTIGHRPDLEVNDLRREKSHLDHDCSPPSDDPNSLEPALLWISDLYCFGWKRYRKVLRDHAKAQKWNLSAPGKNWWPILKSKEAGRGGRIAGEWNRWDALRQVQRGGHRLERGGSP